MQTSHLPLSAVSTIRAKLLLALISLLAFGSPAYADSFASTPMRTIGPFVSGQSGTWTAADDRSVGAMLSGQNGWSSGATCDASLQDQEVMHSDAHTGRQAFRISNWYTSPCVDSVVSPTFAAVGESGSVTAAGAPAVTNSVTYDFWFRSASTAPDPGLSFTTQLSALASYRLTFLKFVDATNAATCPTNACLHLKSTGIESDDGTEDGGVNFVAHYSPALVRGDWYHVVVNATFNDGPLNDVIQTDVYDSIGALVWSDTSNSWEFGYYAGVFNGHTSDPRPVQGPFAAGNVTFDISASTGPGPAGDYSAAAPQGIYVDDLNVVPGSGASYSTSFGGDRWVAAAGGIDSGDCSIQANPCASIAYAISQSSAYNTIHIASGTYAGASLTVALDGLRLIGEDPNNKPLITKQSGGINQPLLVIDGAEDVRVENIKFGMDQSFVSEGILASGFVDGLSITGNDFISSRSASANSKYSWRNAIAINYSNNSQGLPRVDGSSVTVEGNTVVGVDLANGVFLRAGVQMDAGNGSIANNTITAGVHDIVVRFGTATGASSGDTISIDGNQTFGRGLEFDAPNASITQITISNNAIHAPAGINGATAYAADFSLVRLIHNSANVPTTLSGNAFSGHQGDFRGVLVENYPGIVLHNNTFAPAAGAADFVSLVISNKGITTVTPALAPLGMSLTAQGNTFAGSGVIGAGTAVELLNDNDAGGSASFGSLIFGGAGAGEANSFDGDLRWYFHLDDYNCETVNAPTCAFLDYTGAIGADPDTNTQVRPFAGNVAATDNLFAGVAPVAMSPTQQTALSARTYDANANANLGTVDYGLAATAAVVYVDDDYASASHGYGDPLSFTSDATGSLTAYWQIDAFATIPDGVMHVDTGGTVYVAKGSYADHVQISKYLMLIGDGTSASDTLLTDTLDINASGLDAANPVLVQNLRVTDGNGGQNDGVSIDAGSFIHLDNLALVGNPRTGVDFDVASAAAVDHVVISNTLIDGNDVGIRTDSDADVADVLITDSTISNSGKVGLLLFGGSAGSGTISNWSIVNSQFLSNRNADVGPSIWGAGIWLFSYGANAVVDGFSITNSTFADNGSFIDRRQSGIYVVAGAGGQLRNVSICGNTFNETAAGGTQSYGIYVYDDYNYASYEPIEVCANNVFNGMVNSISGENQFTSIGSNPVVNITGGSIAGTNHINTPVLRVRDSASFPTINLALADAGTIAGDEIRAPAGLYHENVVIGMNGIKLVGAGTTLPLPAPSASAMAGPTVAPVAVLDGTGLTGAGVDINGGADDVTLAGFEIRNYADTCVRGQGGSNGVTVQNNLVHHCGDSSHDSGIYLNVGGSLVGANLNYNEIHDVYDRGIVIWNGSKQDVTIGNNWIHGPVGSTAIGLEDGTATGVQIVNNTIDNSLPGDPAGYGGDTGIAIVQLTSGSPSARANLLANNNITNPGRFGISLLIPNGTGLDTGDGAIVVEDNIVTGGANLGGFSDDDRAGIQVIRRYFTLGQGQVDVTRGVVIRNNTVSDFAHPSPINPGVEGYGIVVEGFASVVSGNTLSGNDVGLQVQQGNQPASLPGNSVLPAYTEWFDRGNTPLSCANVGTNTISGNVIDFRTQPAGVSLLATVTNTTSGEVFCSIQAAIDDTDTAAGDVIQVGAGSYAENVVVNKSVILQGPFAGTAGYDATRTGTGEAVIVPATGVALSFVSPNTVVEGLTVKGSIAGNANAVTLANASADNISLVNNRILDVVDASGIAAEPGADCAADGFLISANLFRNISGGGATDGRGIRLGNGFCNVQILDNAFDTMTYAVNANGGNGTVQDLTITGNSVQNTTGTAFVLTNTTRTLLQDNSATSVAGGLFLSDSMDDFTASCNVFSSSGRGISTFDFFGGTANTDVHIFHNAIEGGTADVNNALAQGLLVGSNWYGGNAPVVTGSGAQVADPLAASPIGNAACGDNTPMQVVAYAGSGQTTPINTAFTNPLDARVVDALGGAVMGETIAFAAPASGASATLGSAGGSTDFNGVVSSTATANGIGGSYAVTASSGSLSPAAFTLTNQRLVGSVTWDELTWVYDGANHTATAYLTEEPSVACTVTSAGPVGPAAGDYPVHAECVGIAYMASGDAVATITPAPAVVTLSNLTQVFDGSPKSVTVTTTPASVTVDVTYDGSTTAPSAVGDYAVEATVSDPNYTGSASGTLHIVEADAPDLAVTITDDRSYEQYNELLTYTITVNNLGNTDITGASVDSVLPATLEHADPSWTCMAVGTATCTAGGAGDLHDTVDIPAGGGVVYLFNAWVKDDQSLTTDVIETTVTVAATSDANSGNNSATDTTQAVIFRDGFELDGDGAEPALWAGTPSTLGSVTASNTHMLDLSGAWMSDGRVLRLAALRGTASDALRIEAIRVAGALKVRVVGNGNGKHQLSGWVDVPKDGRQLAAGLLLDEHDQRWLLVVGAAHDIATPLSAASASLMLSGPSGG